MDHKDSRSQLTVRANEQNVVVGPFKLLVNGPSATAHPVSREITTCTVHLTLGCLTACDFRLISHTVLGNRPRLLAHFFNGYFNTHHPWKTFLVFIKQSSRRIWWPALDCWLTEWTWVRQIIFLFRFSLKRGRQVAVPEQKPSATQGHQFGCGWSGCLHNPFFFQSYQSNLSIHFWRKRPLSCP